MQNAVQCASSKAKLIVQARDLASINALSGKIQSIRVVFACDFVQDKRDHRLYEVVQRLIRVIFTRSLRYSLRFRTRSTLFML